MATKSQAELEAPAKVYQLDAVDTKVSDVLKKLDTVLSQTKGVATVSDVTVAKDAAITSAKEYVDEEISKVYLTYKPMQTEHNWVKYTLIGGLFIQVLIGVVLWLITRG